MPRSVKKGPFVDDHVVRKVENANTTGNKQVIKDLVATLNDYA